MASLGEAMVASLALSLAVAGWAAAQKARLDAQAHLLAGDSLRDHALAGDTAELAAAGEAYLRALRCYVPLGDEPERAAASLSAVAREMGGRKEPDRARRLLDEGLAAIDSATIVLTPLAHERAEMSLLRETLGASLPEVMPPPLAALPEGAATASPMESPR